MFGGGGGWGGPRPYKKSIFARVPQFQDIKTFAPASGVCVCGGGGGLDPFDPLTLH